MANMKSITDFTWCTFNHLTIYQKAKLCKIKPPTAASTSAAGEESSTAVAQGLPLKDVEWDTNLYHNPGSRAMISETSFIYQDIQSTVCENQALSKEELLKTSRKYRSVIHATLAKLSYSPEDKRHKQMLHQIEVIWHLCEILFIDIHQTGILLGQLLLWIRWHFSSVNRRTGTVLDSSSPHDHPDYWDSILGFVLQGEVENAANMLSLHPDVAQKEQYSTVLDLLNRMPVFTGHQMLYEYYMRWQAWSSECQKVFEESTFDGESEGADQLKTVVGLLAGDLDTFKSVQSLMHSWHHFMIALLLYTDPHIKENDLSSLSKECMELYYGSNSSVGNQSRVTAFDRILLSAFNYDLMEVLLESCASFKDNFWFAAHFADLLANARQLEKHNVEQAEKLREFLVLDYASSLMAHPSLWSIAVPYFDSCPSEGLQLLELSLERIPVRLESTGRSLKVMDIAEKRGLKSIASGVARNIAKSWLARERLGSALAWAVRSEDASLTTNIADRFLRHYLETGEFPDEDVLESLGSLMLISDRLTFLGKYFEFHRLRRAGVYKAAGETLISLISSRIAPKFFVPILLTDAIPLLEANALIFTSDETFHIMAALEDLSAGKRLPENIQSPIADSLKSHILKDKEDMLRIALARNMARALISSVKAAG